MRRVSAFLTALVAALWLVASCDNGTESATTVTSTVVSPTTVTAFATPTTNSATTRPTSTPSVGPGTQLGAETAAMRYGHAKVNPLEPCTVLDPDAGDLVGRPLLPSRSTPNSCAAYDDGKGFGLLGHVGNMADAVGTIRRCVYAEDDEDQCERPDIADNFDARTYVQSGVTVITQDVINDDGGLLAAAVAISDQAWVDVHVFFYGKPTTMTRQILNKLITQLIRRANN